MTDKITLTAQQLKDQIDRAQLEGVAIAWGAIENLIRSGTPADGLLLIAQGNRESIERHLKFSEGAFDECQ